MQSRLSPIVLIYLIGEAGYRVYRFDRLKRDFPAHSRYVLSSFEGPLDLLDAKTGFGYKTSTRVHQRLYDRDGKMLRHVSTEVTNNVGLISPTDAAMEKPASEYRIVVMGESFCATTSSVTWPRALEETRTIP